MKHKPLQLMNKPGGSTSFFRFENEDFKVRVMYFGADYNKSLENKAFSPEDVFVQIHPKDELAVPLDVEFILETDSTEHNAWFKFTDVVSYNQGNVDKLYYAVDAALDVISGVEEVLRTYFPGTLNEDS